MAVSWRATLLAIAVLTATSAPSVAQNLVVNGDFETGDLTGWTQFKAAGAGWAVVSGVSHGGNFAAETPCAIAAFNCSLVQTLQLRVGAKYQVALWAEARGGGNPDGLQVRIGPGSWPLSTSPVINVTNVPAIYTFYSGTFTATSASELLQISAFNGPGAEVIDDVSVALVQSPLMSQLPSNAPTNAVKVAGAIDNFTNNGGALPTGFQNLNLYGLTGSQLVGALTQLDGEAAVDAEKGAFQLMNQFLGLMVDPFVTGRTGGGTPLGFAPDREASLPPEIALAYASVLKAPPKPSYDGGWTAWGTAFGGSGVTNGNAAAGSSNVTVGDFGFAAGADYHFNRDALAGFAFAGGGTNWGLAQGLGGGRSDALQIGSYAKSYFGPGYLAGALAFANHWMTTDRVAFGDALTARFDGQSYAGRLEAGYRNVVPFTGLGVAPYAAVQTQWFHTPGYGETDLSGGGLGLTYNAMTANDTRSELGARFDDPVVLANGMPLVLRGRLAWAHDWVTNPSLDAVFQSLPGASFVVDGAAPPADSALVSVGAELHLTRNWSVQAKFDGELAHSSQTYAGIGTARYVW